MGEIGLDMLIRNNGRWRGEERRCLIAGVGLREEDDKFLLVL